MTSRLFLAYAAAAVVLGAPMRFARAQPPPQRVPPQTAALQPRTIFSTSRRFLVTGLPPAAATDIARWADEVAKRIEEAVGPIPFGRGDVVEIAGRAIPDGGAPGVTVLQTLGDDQLVQRLELTGVQDLDQEDALEGLAGLLLNRCAIAQQDAAAQKAGLARVPAWLAVGIAQNLYVELRERNVRVGLARWSKGESDALDDLTAREVLPPGRWAEKVDAALFVAWLEVLPTASDILGRAFHRCARHEPLSARWWLEQATGLSDPGQAERQWELWVAQQRDARRGWGGVDSRSASALRELRQIPPAERALLDVPAGEEPMELKDLIPHRREKWARQLANRLSLQIRLSALGQSPDYQDVAGQYSAFLEAITGRAPRYKGGLFGRGPSARQLRVLLEKADASLQRVEDELKARDAYLSRVSSQLFTPAPTPSSPVAPDPAVGQYLDEMEQRLDDAAP